MGKGNVGGGRPHRPPPPPYAEDDDDEGERNRPSNPGPGPFIPALALPSAVVFKCNRFLDDVADVALPGPAAERGGRLVAAAMAMGKSGTDILLSGALTLLNAGDKGAPALKLGLGLLPLAAAPPLPLAAVGPSLDEAKFFPCPGPCSGCCCWKENVPPEWLLLL